MVHTTPHDTEFRFADDHARQVYLVGDFNNWEAGRHPMSRSEAGEWTCHVELPEGVYQFRFLVDGRWCMDRGAVGVGWAPFDCNSITILREREQPAFPVG